MPKIVWVHNFATHYTVRLFERVHARLGAQFLFFSGGGERYWLKDHGIAAGHFPHEYLGGVTIGGTRLALALPWRLWRSECDAIVHGIDGKFALPVSYLVARLRRKPFVLYTGVWMRMGTWLHRLAFPFVRHVYRNAAAVVVYGEHVKRYLLTEGVAPGRIFVEPHAVDNGIYGRAVSEEETGRLRRELGIGERARVVLYLGRLEPEKGLEHLLGAFAALRDPEAVLVMAGKGAERERLEELAADLGIETRLRWAGYVPAEATPPYYAMASVFVLPSITTKRDKETWGLVVNEAFNQGLPVIATDAVGAAAGGLVEDGVNGAIVPEGDTAALGEALRRVLGDENGRRTMGEAARRKIGAWNQEAAAAAVEAAVRFATGMPAAGRAPEAGGVSVVIPVHNRKGYTRRCLEGLARQSARGFLVIVVDDGSTDGTGEMVRREFPWVRLLEADGTKWWSGATNLGVAEARRLGATHVLTLNDDTEPPPDLMENLLSAAAARPGALIGALAVDAASGAAVYGGEWMRWITASARNLLRDGDRRGERLVETTHFPGRGLLIPVAVFERIGVFDADHFPQTAADYDFTHRARRAGFRIYCDTESRLPIHPEASGDARFRREKGWKNYGRHLFDRRGGGNLRVFFWYAVRNCPKPLLPLCLTCGLARRAGGYLLEWLTETL